MVIAETGQKEAIEEGQKQDKKRQLSKGRNRRKRGN